MRYLDPKNDLTFKKVFGQHPHLLQSFLNALLPLAEGTEIVSLEYLSPELVPDIPIMKNTIVDVRCIDNHGRQFIVEMQMLWTDSFMSRVLFNASKAYVRQLNEKIEYKYLQPVYSLNLIDDDMRLGIPEWYHHYKIVNIQNTNKQLKGLEFIFVELPKFKAANIRDKKLQVLWLRYLTEISSSTTTISSELLSNQYISEAITQLYESAFTKEELATYDKYWDQVRVEKTLIDDAHTKGRSEGIAEGQEVGRAIGIAEGIERGIEKGMFLIAIKAIRKGMKDADLHELTTLPGSTLEKLKALVDKYGNNAEHYLNEVIIG